MNNTDIILYQTEDGKNRIDVKIENNTVWLTQKQLSELYQIKINTINEHINNILKESELDEATIRKFRIVQKEGKREVERLIEHYNLEMILAVGYRVRSHRGTQFRKWATDKLQEYLIKGFALDDRRLKEGLNFGVDYFDELLERIKDIRASEKRFYLKICDIYALSIDYDAKNELTIEFFKEIQNKFHYGAHGNTAPEIIYNRADANKPNMGLTSWSGSKVRKNDIFVAKNYLNEQELINLNNLVDMYLDFAEDRAKNNIPMYMKDWKELLDDVLKVARKNILKDAGKISRELADKKAIDEYETYNTQRIKQQENVNIIEEVLSDIKTIEHKKK